MLWWRRQQSGLKQKAAGSRQEQVAECPICFSLSLRFAIQTSGDILVRQRQAEAYRTLAALPHPVRKASGFATASLTVHTATPPRGIASLLEPAIGKPEAFRTECGTASAAACTRTCSSSCTCSCFFMLYCAPRPERFQEFLPTQVNLVFLSQR